MRRKKSREVWLKEGDRNTRFFHKMVNTHKRHYDIVSLKVNGAWVNEGQDLKEGIANAFQVLLTDPENLRAKLEGLYFTKSDEREARSLELSFSKEEVRATLYELNGEKALSPDGFTAIFWQFSWNTVKNKVMVVFKDFFDMGKFVKSLNSTFIVMIPKKEGAEDLKDFRPISLVGSLCNLISKMLANRLKKVMNQLVNKAQNAFVEGRQILDASLIANEVIDSMVKGKERGVLCKLDIEKAYDQINLKLLISVLKEMGFGCKWIEWVKWCIFTASFSVLINGSSNGFFSSTRGLRQGDPLSPYLFFLGMEVFSLLIDKDVSGGFLIGYTLKGRNGEAVTISHLLFADDILVFCRDSEDQMVYLSWILLYFEALFGLKVNLGKSAILPVGDVENIEQLACELGCKAGTLPSTYLGLSLSTRQNSVRIWEGIEERFRKRLIAWKRQYISKGGRLTLIRSTLSNLPIYLLSLFRLPKGVKSKLEKIQRDFLWGGGSETRKIHLVN